MPTTASKAPAKRAPRKTVARPAEPGDSTTLGLVDRRAMASLIEELLSRVLTPQLEGFRDVIGGLVGRHAETEAVAISQAAEIGRLRSELQHAEQERDRLMAENDRLRLENDRLRGGWKLGPIRLGA